MIISNDILISKIYFIRGYKVMLDRDLALLYDVETKNLKRQVKRNLDRFPSDFMFELNDDELNNLRCQIGTSSWGGSRYKPMAFTEQGVAQLSSVLSSHKAIQVNIQIISLFTKMRNLLLTHKNLILKMEKLEQNMFKQQADIKLLFDYIKRIHSAKAKEIKQSKRRNIGFKS